MMLRWGRPVTLVGGQVVTEQGLASSIRFSSRVLAVNEPPARGDTVLDLAGGVVLPGLVNAHDHLELNHYGALRPRGRYDNALDWIDDLRPLIRSDARILAASRQPLTDRLFIGGLKNLLAGVTTVAHHNPLYRGARRAVPVRLVERFGWAHSLGMQDQPVGAGGERGGNVGERYRATPGTVPFLVHASEGIDGRACAELSRLRDAGCVGRNTVMVHGVAWSTDDWQRVVDAGAALVWCPVSNQFLFGCTASVPRFIEANPAGLDHLCLGSDSRLTGARDLLDELRAAHDAGVSPAHLLQMVTRNPARLLRLPEAGRLRVGGPADLIVVPPAPGGPAESLLHASRCHLRLIVVGGRVMLGAPDMRAVFDARGVAVAPMVVDETERLVAAPLARAIARCPITEPGVHSLRVA